MADLISFDQPSGVRIARVVRAVEQAIPRTKALTYTPIFTERRGGGSKLRLGKTTAQWTKNTLQAIDLYERCDPPNEQRNQENYTLANVVNHWADIPSDRWVMVGLASNGYWYVITAECG